MRFFRAILSWFFLSAVLAEAADVSLRQDARNFQISNGQLSATIERSSGRVKSIQLGGQELLGSGSGYWSMAASSRREPVEGFGVSREQFVSIDPATNGGERAEVACKFHGTGKDDAYPGPCEVRYSMDRKSTTLYATAILSHGPGDGPFRIGEGRFVLKLDAGIFDQLTVDKDRNWIMPTGRDWDEGAPLNLKEARRIMTGIHAGWAEHKYSYSAILEKVPAYGWLGTKRRFGVWMINPSMEYIAGGPTKMELTGHLDVGGSALPTLLNMWHGSHYGGSALGLEANERWSKVIGPFAIHFNQGGNPDELWASALRQAAMERAAWPYPWLIHEAYPAAPLRGSLTGKLVIDETLSLPVAEGSLWVGLTTPYQAREWRSRETVGWQRDGRNYQYWARAAGDGTFSLAGVRPGTYTLHAFANGISGEFQRSGITIGAGQATQTGGLRWVPERAGPTLWEIGVPDRSAAEFRNGDRYWHWGNYLKFKSDFPHGVDYTVGRSDWSKDWHICQPLDLSPECKVLGSSTWTVRFPLQQIPEGGALLRLDFCGSREGSSLALLLNGSAVCNTGPLPENGAMHRDSHRGMWFQRTIGIPTARLRTGENILQFQLQGNTWHQGVLYDYIRLEAVPASSPSL